MLTNAGKLKTWNILKNKNITNAEYFPFMSVFNAIPLEWKNLMKVQLQNIETFSNVARDFAFPNSSMVLYWDLVKKIGTTPTSKHKYKELLPTTDLPWQEIYLLPRSATVDSKPREFQYKCLNRIVFTNKVLYKMGIVDSPMCNFCGKSEESLEHPFIYCEISKKLWLLETKWLKDYFINFHSLNSIDTTFGFFRKDFLLLNHIIIICKQVIFQCRSLDIKPSLALLKARIKNVYQVELFIAKNNKSLETLNKKWKELLPVV